MTFFMKNLPKRILTSISLLNKTPLIDVKRGIETKLEKEWILQNNIKIKEAIKGNLRFIRPNNFWHVIKAEKK